MSFQVFALARATHFVCATSCPHTSIAAAIAIASPGDVIDISGVITESGIVVNKDLTIRGQNISTSIVQGASTLAAATDRVFEVVPGVSVNFQNLTIRNGKTNGTDNGAGVHIDCNASTNVSFSGVRITNCMSAQSSGGVAIEGSDGTVTFNNCVLDNNEADNTDAMADGGAIFNEGATTFNINRSTIHSNIAGDDAGAIYNHVTGSNVQITNSTIFDNSAGASAAVAAAGGIYLFNGASFLLTNNTIVNNTLATVSADRRGAGIYYTSFIGGNLQLVNTIVANNSGATQGNDILINTNGPISQMNSLVESCQTRFGSACPVFSFTSDANIATTPNTCGIHSYFDVMASDAEDNGLAPGGSIPSVDICGNTRVAAHDIGSVDVFASVPNPVPALSEWGGFLMVLTMLCLGLITFYNVERRQQLEHSLILTDGNTHNNAFTDGVFFSTNVFIPFDKIIFLQILKKVLLCIPVGFVCIYLGWGTVLVDDLIGMSFAMPMITYLVYLLRIR